MTDDIVVVRRADQEFVTAMGAPWREITDHRPERGPLAGLEAAIDATRHDLIVAIACDMPMMRGAVIAAVAAAARDVEIAMPLVDDHAQPLLAAYRRSVAPHVRALLDSGEGRLRALLPLVQHTLIGEDVLRMHDPELESLTNVNRAEDLERVDQLLRRRNAATVDAADAEEND